MGFPLAAYSSTGHIILLGGLLPLKYSQGLLHNRGIGIQLLLSSPGWVNLEGMFILSLSLVPSLSRCYRFRIFTLKDSLYLPLAVPTWVLAFVFRINFFCLFRHHLWHKSGTNLERLGYIYICMYIYILACAIHTAILVMLIG